MNQSIPIILTLLISLISITSGQMNWMKDPNNPVMSGGGDGAWDRHVFWPNVIYNYDSLRYEMWYGVSAARTDESWFPNPMGYAHSRDGITWEKYFDPVMEGTPGTWDAFTTRGQTVIRENGSYKMWYVGFSSEDDPGGIGYATSNDGLNWIKETSINPVIVPEEAWEAGGFRTVYVLPVEEGYKMWYTGWNVDRSRADIGYATSIDGEIWVKDTQHNPVLTCGESEQWDSQFVVDPHVLRIDSLYYMFFGGNNYPDFGTLRQTGLALSTDGIYWEKYNDPSTDSEMYRDSDPVLKPDINQWDEDFVQAGTVRLEGDAVRMWYSGSRSDTYIYLWRIGHAVISVDSLKKYTVLTLDDDFNRRLPAGFSLHQNYPNPFNPTTTINYELQITNYIELSIFNLLGQRVITLVSEKQNAGYHQVEWNASGFASGVYYYVLEAGDFRDMKKMILLK
jgi:predicted GH43/DUF377 family glycosyl hydrolase